jgi:hypothetical protein
VGVGASPSCGVFHTLDVPRSLEVIAGSQLASADTRRFNTALMASARIDGQGYFIRALRRGLARRGLTIAFHEHDLAAELAVQEADHVGLVGTLYSHGAHCTERP